MSRLSSILLIITLTTLQAIAQQTPGVAVLIVKGQTEIEGKHLGIRRIRTYDVSSAEIPQSFDGFRILFIADTHYPSLFTDRTLASLGTVVSEIAPDAIMLGGDYQEGCEYVEPLFATIMRHPPKYGAYAILGNNDIERCTDTIIDLMRAYDIKFVEDTAVRINKGHSHITVAGATNTYKAFEENPSPTLNLPPEEFVILLTHTPDYAEDQDIANTDLVLAGHTHGGQVTFLGFLAPVTASHYGQRFLKGLNYNTAGQPVITTTGIGTSRRNIRLFAPSEVVLLTLHSWSRNERLPEPDIAIDTRPYLSQPITIVPETTYQEPLNIPQKL